MYVKIFQSKCMKDEKNKLLLKKEKSFDLNLQTLHQNKLKHRPNSSKDLLLLNMIWYYQIEYTVKV